MDYSDNSGIDLGEVILEGVTIYDPMDDKVGSISHVHGTGQSIQVAVDVGTFLGLGGKTVLIPLSALEVEIDDDGDVQITTVWTKDEIEALPEHVM